ncbi:hypothetical protein AALC25_15445 [Lachnospiraceae bacterium 29-84]
MAALIKQAEEGLSKWHCAQDTALAGWLGGMPCMDITGRLGQGIQ